jgi:hypothetical protein
VRRSAAAWVAVALVLAGCGGASKQASTDRTFSTPALPFTFQYPDGFRASAARQGNALATVAFDPRNGLAIRQTSSRELDPDQYLAGLRADFQRRGLRVTERREQHAGQQMGVLAFVIPGRIAGAAGLPLRSTNYFFAGGGRTWQLECRYADRRAEVDRACQEALSTLRFR